MPPSRRCACPTPLRQQPHSPPTPPAAPTSPGSGCSAPCGRWPRRPRSRPDRAPALTYSGGDTTGTRHRGGTTVLAGPAGFVAGTTAEADGNRTRLTELLGHVGFEDRGGHQAPRRLPGTDPA